MSRNNWRSTNGGKGKGQGRKKRGPGVGGGTRPLFIEELEVRLAPAVDLTYADLAATPPLTAAGITGYLASVISTNYTLKAEGTPGDA